MKNKDGFNSVFKARVDLLKALCVLFFILGLILVICAFSLRQYLTLNHKLGTYVFTNNQEIDVSVDIDISNEYNLSLYFPRKQFEGDKDWEIYGFGDRLTTRNGKHINSGIPISLSFNITSNDHLTTFFTDIAGIHSRCSSCRDAEKPIFLSKGVNNIKLKMSAKEEFFRGRKFQLELLISKKTSPQASFLYKLWRFSGDNLLLIALFSLLTFVPYIIIDIKEGYK